MDQPAFSGLLLVVSVAFAAPFLLGFFPSVRLPAVVLEIVAGIVIGPAVLGWVEIDETISVLSTIGLVFLLFLAGLEVEFENSVAGSCGSPSAAGCSRSPSPSWPGWR
jgi:Kef-type K+ transport system membrane component KefB